MKAGLFGKATLWFATLVASALFLLAGTQKLAASPPHPTNFIGWGYPLWVMFFVGAVETAGAILLLVPRLTSFGAALISAVAIHGLTDVTILSLQAGLLFALLIAGTGIYECDRVTQRQFSLRTAIFGVLSSDQPTEH